MCLYVLLILELYQFYIIFIWTFLCWLQFEKNATTTKKNLKWGHLRKMFHFSKQKNVYKYSRCRSKLGNKLKIKWKIYRFPIGRTNFLLFKLKIIIIQWVLFFILNGTTREIHTNTCEPCQCVYMQSMQHRPLSNQPHSLHCHMQRAKAHTRTHSYEGKPIYCPLQIIIMTNKINSYVADKGLLFAAVIQPMCLAIVALCAFVSICVRTRLVLAYKVVRGNTVIVFTSK